MIDTKKIPHLQPEPVSLENEEGFEEETIQEQVASLFSTKKGFCLCCLISLLIYMSICFQGERLLRNSVYQISQKLGEDGFGISYEAPSSYLALKSGVHLDDLVISAPKQMGSWVLKASRISITSNPFTPRHIEIKLNGTHSLTTPSIGDIRFVVGKGDLSIHRQTKKSPFSIKTIFKNIQTATPKSMEGFFLSHFSFEAEQEIKKSSEQTTLTFHTVLENMHLPAYLAQHLPKIVEYASLSGETSLQETESSGAFFSQWTRTGGTAEITQAEVIWQPFMAQFSGTFGLNNVFELTGAFVAKVYGFFELLDMFERGHFVRSSQVSMAKIVLGKDLKRAQGENQPSLSAPFSFQTGKIYAGSVLLYDKKEK